MDLIEDWRNEGRIKIPDDTALYKELTMITREDLDQSPELRFPAINALRFVVGAYQKFNFAPVQLPLRRRRRPWMAA